MHPDLFGHLPPQPRVPPPFIHPPFSLPPLPGYAAQYDSAQQGWLIQVPGGQLHYIPAFFNPALCARCIAYLQEFHGGDWQQMDWKSLDAQSLAQIPFRHLHWQQDHIRIYGKTQALPRWTAWYGDPGASYGYAGIHSQPRPWNRGLRYIKNRVEAASGTAFNGVLLNWYRDGLDRMGWHADDEPELGRRPTIASLSLGHTRDFVLRRNDDHQQKLCIPLVSGSLLIMAGDLQQCWQHAMPARKRATGSRFNLSFRWVHS